MKVNGCVNFDNHKKPSSTSYMSGYELNVYCSTFRCAMLYWVISICYPICLM